MNAFSRAVRSSLLLWRTNPGLALTALVALAMGIGFTTTMFSIVHGATRPLPLPDGDEIVAIQKLAVRPDVDASTRPYDVRRWSERARSFEAIGAYESLALTLATGSAEPERLQATRTTPNLFTIAARPAWLGRALQPGDDRHGATPVVVLAYDVWQTRFGGDAAVVGRTIRLGGLPHVVVGVMPPRFGFPINPDLWVPLALTGAEAEGEGPRLQAFGRLRGEVALPAAQAELDTLLREGATPEVRVEVLPFKDIETPREVIRGLYLLVLASSFVLIIACSNVANLLLARAAIRARDAALRLALGATTADLVRERAAEIVPVAFGAAMLGLGVAFAGTRLFAVNTAHIIEAFWVDFRVDLAVATCAALLAVLATLCAGVWPALRASRAGVVEVLKDRAATIAVGPGRLGRALIGLQVALACALLAFTMTLGRTAVAIRAVPWSFDPSAVLTFGLDLPSRDGEEPLARQRRLAAVLEAIGSASGVEATAVATALPGRGAGNWRFTLDAPPAASGARLVTPVAFVSPGFFDVVQAKALSGRLLGPGDTTGAPRVVVVNESFVRRFSATQSPIGRRVYFGEREFEIVGVVPDLMAGDVQDRRQDGMYASILQSQPFGLRVMARGALAPMSLLPAIRAAIRGVEPDAAMAEILTLSDAVYLDKRILDVLSGLFFVFAVGALSLTAVGLYGVVAFATAQRTREIGIRLALGATRRQIAVLVAAQGGRQLGIGLGAGLVLAVALSRGFAAAVEAIPPADLPLLAVVAGVLGITVAAAVVVPTRRAIALDPSRALRDN